MAVSENDLVVGPLVPAAGVTTISLDFDGTGWEAEWLRVYKGASDTPLILGTDFSVTGSGTVSASITLTVAANGVDAYSVYLQTPLQRVSDFQLRGEFKSDPLNKELDRIWQRLQYHDTILGKTLRVKRNEASPDAIAVGAGEVIRRSDDGSAFVGAALSISVSTDTVTFQARDTTSATAAVGKADGTFVLIAGAFYEVDSSATGTSSATYDLGVDGLKAVPGPSGCVSVQQFGAAGDGVTDDTSAFQRALASGHDVFAGAGTYLITDTLRVDLKALRGQNANKTTLKFNHTNGDFAVKVQTSQRGGGIENVCLQAAVDGLKGLLLEGTVIARAQQIFILDFTSVAMQLGNSPTANGIYWSKVSGVRIAMDNSKTGTTGVLIEGAAIPGSNANTLEDVVIGGAYDRPLHIQGRGNTVTGGTIEMINAPVGSVSSMIYIEGSGNKISGAYVEPVGTPPDILIEFGSGASGNIVDIWPQYIPPYNVSAAIIDAGEHNKVSLRRPGQNYKIGPEAAPGPNLLMNAAFDTWRDAENPHGWLFGTAGRISRVAAAAAGEPNILRMTLTANAATIQSYVTDYFSSTSGVVPVDPEFLRGKPIMCGVWCRTTVAGAGSVKFNRGTGSVAGAGQDRHSGSGDWELLLAHGNFLEAHDRGGIELRSHVTNDPITGTVDFRDPFFVIGSDVPFFSPKPLFDGGGKMFGDLEFPLDYTDKARGGVLRLNGYYLWVDTTGDLRIGATRPTNATWDTAGAVVGTQT